MSNLQPNERQLPKPRGHYGYAVTHAGVAYLSGQLPLNAAGEPDGAMSFDAQAQAVFAQLDAVLASVGSSKERLLRVTVYITEIALWPQFNALYAQWLDTHRPARTVVPVPELHYGLQLEIDAIAAVETA